MLAEKFFLVLETLRSHAFDDRPEIVTHSVQKNNATPGTATSGTTSELQRKTADERN